MNETRKARRRSLFDPQILKRAVGDSFRKLNPLTLAKNPVMLVVEVGAVITAVEAVRTAIAEGGLAFTIWISVWLWFTVLFANLAEAVAEGRGKAQADSLRQTRTETEAHKLIDDGKEVVLASQLRAGDIVYVQAGEIIPADGEIVEGIASVDESAITGESAPVIRESGGDRSAVTGGTKVLSDWVKVRVTANPGESFLDHMISLVEGAERQKTPNEIALSILLSGLTIIFLLVVITLQPFAIFSGRAVGVTILIALLVTLIPTTIGALLSAIGIAGLDRLVQHNVLAMSGRAVEAAGDVDTLLLDKTGTITLGNRMATDFIPLPEVEEKDLADAAQLSSLSDETPEGRSIVVLAKEFGIRERQLSEKEAVFVPFTAETRMSGVDLDGREIRKGAVDAIAAYVKSKGKEAPTELSRIVEGIASSGGTPLVVARDGVPLGVVHLKDVVKGGIRERFARLRSMGIKTVMITGDNPLTAAAIAAEAGVDDFLAEATPETKMKLIREEQAQGKLVAMMGDGTNEEEDDCQ
ncbi:MAG: potassium-transporting ATPase subunit KdpB, partial [Actinobacteria bacterium]|nr:potassium-transporting ATPase subunit KdpB [Actinomycetota bacterium]